MGTIWVRRIAMALAITAASAAPAAAQQHIEGQTGPGSFYALDVPAAWNGDLVVYAHGIVDPVMPVALPSAQDNFTGILAALMDRGYAVASSSALNVIGFNLRYTTNVLEHTHGHIPFDNLDVEYAGSFDDAALNAGIQRWAGDRDALNVLAHYYDPTGALRVPVQTLHSDRDPVVPAWHETLFADLVRGQAASYLLEQRIVPAYGHCTFTPEQTLSAFDRLVARVTGQ